MRIREDNDEETNRTLQEFGKWILDVGDRTIPDTGNGKR